MNPKLARGRQDSAVVSTVGGLDIDGVDPENSSQERSSGAGVQAPVYSCGHGDR